MEKLTEGHKNSPVALLATEADSGNQECHVSCIIVVIVSIVLFSDFFLIITQYQTIVV